MAAKEAAQLHARGVAHIPGDGMIIQVGVERLDKNRLKGVVLAVWTEHGRTSFLSIIADNLLDVYAWDP